MQSEHTRRAFLKPGVCSARSSFGEVNQRVNDMGGDLSSSPALNLSIMVRLVSQDAANDINAELSKRLAQERQSRGFSKKSLAGLADIDRSTVKFIEDPEENPTILNLIRYGLALKLDVGKLLSECLEPHLTEAKPKVAKTKKVK